MSMNNIICQSLRLSNCPCYRNETILKYIGKPNKNPFQSITTTSLRLQENHYDSLGLTPKATQLDIKTAYYKLSMLYHPDKNKGSGEAAHKFRDITAAYEILGNLRLRKLYDRGILGPNKRPLTDAEYRAQTEDDNQAKFYKQHAQRQRQPTPTGRTPIYDFDEWARSHYGVNFNKRQRAKQNYEHRAKMEVVRANGLRLELAIFGFAFSIFLVLWLTSLTYTNYDKATNKIEPDKIK